MSLFGQDTSFYDLLEAQATSALNSARLLHTLVLEMPKAGKHAQALKDLEHEADQLIYKMTHRIDSTFVTPLDKEDLHALTTSLDDITDSIEAAGSRFVLFGVREARQDLSAMTDLLTQTVQTVYDAVAGLRKLHSGAHVPEALLKIHDLESEGDALFRTALGALFESSSSDPITVIKWKDIYERIEKAIDRCEQAANIVEGIVVKYA